MKYWVIFVTVLTTLFGGFCMGAIDMSQKYIVSINSECNPDMSFREKCGTIHYSRDF